MAIKARGEVTEPNVWLGHFRGEIVTGTCGHEFIRPQQGEYGKCLPCESKERSDPRELDRIAGEAYRRGDFHEALRCLEAARGLDTSNPTISDHLARVRAAERTAVANALRPRDMDKVADTFGERLGVQELYERQRDANRLAPVEPCVLPKGNSYCGELGHPYRDGRGLCDEAPAPARRARARVALGTGRKQHGDLCARPEGVPGSVTQQGPRRHECILPDREPGQ